MPSGAAGFYKNNLTATLGDLVSVEARHFRTRLGGMVTRSLTQLTLTFSVGLGTSLVASAISNAITGQDHQPPNITINVNNIEINISDPDFLHQISRAVRQHVQH